MPQEKVLGPILCLFYTCDIPQSEHDTIARFASNNAILTGRNNINIEATLKLQTAIKKVQAWKINLNETKSVHVDLQ